MVSSNDVPIKFLRFIQLRFYLSGLSHSRTSISTCDSDLNRNTNTQIQIKLHKYTVSGLSHSRTSISTCDSDLNRNTNTQSCKYLPTNIIYKKLLAVPSHHQHVSAMTVINNYMVPTKVQRKTYLLTCFITL